MTRSRMYGLSVDADFDLHQSGHGFQGGADVVITTGDAFDEWPQTPAGEILLHFETDEPWYTLTRSTATAILQFRVHGVCDYTIAPSLDAVVLRMHSSVEPGMDSVMTTGTLLSLLLWLRGTHVLHGSAVEFDGAAVGFVGHSGQGKTTMATALCAEGASVVTDDVLVVDQLPQGPFVRRGSSELRLRSGSESLIEGLHQVESVRMSADERRVIAPGSTGFDHAPLRALVIPCPTRDGSPFRLERLAKPQAAVALLQYPRLMGWQDAAVAQASFRHIVSIASAVPVFIAYVPWGPPFPADMGHAILAEAAAA
ncbi:MAG: hypothetical protein EPN48_08990 [Microbacteriaceae bacterium]|nr:MAG: hypothetical protein EPN48_08990 [Microbacteriaceae bacterium]